MRLLSIIALLSLTTLGLAADEKVKKPTGTWSKKAGDFELKFQFKEKDIVIFTMSNGSDGCELEATYTQTKDGTLKCETTRFEKKGQFPVEKSKGFKFSFKMETKEKTAKISDFTGDDVTDEAKQTLEGEYTKE